MNAVPSFNFRHFSSPWPRPGFFPEALSSFCHARAGFSSLHHLPMTDDRQRRSKIQNPKSKIPHYHIYSTAFGYTAILFQTEPFLVKRIYLPHSHKRALKKRIQKTGPANPGHTRAVLNMCNDIQAYYEGNPIKTPWKFLDISGLTPLQRSVLEAVSSVPHGEIRSYGQIAAQVGHPRACRFVGTTLARNPFPILIPCHRIVRADGSPGGFYGGTDLKKRMLLLEKRKAGLQ